MSGIVLSLCDLTGNMVRPWANAGFECWCVDTQHRGVQVRDGIRFVDCDVRRFLPPKQTEIVFAFPPWNFGDMESKKTCLWTGGGFVMPEFECVTKPEGVRESVWRCPPGAERSNIRSATFEGFARAVFEANCTAIVK